ncbi:ABC transporter ATP-binding protein [Jiangella alkaliphila]|uniref:NitT/TauT family transport system ATP-binding protein n=1 Tax=Jiangella alkaliphila TaxID=419479 RepID=A0A1H2LDH2_9ACTN|nr:ABC transporter ATP-binding protein [Jiangella alkaliphila]SDU79090.1 NitT/TauT family transport system ATP-binding protein [Jiangella alkaliphila]
MAVEDPRLVDVRDVGHEYVVGRDRRRVLGRISFTAGKGEFVCIVGPSGVGKTTILRCIAGLQLATHGDVFIDGARLTGPSRSVGLVFQDYSRSLMPWMTVADNVALPLLGRTSRAERDERVRAALAEVNLDQHADSRTWQLSGGMQQRVAIARALAFGPPVLLMDEPFASVDAQTRAELEDLTLRVRDESGQAVILITHDIDEAIYLADTVVVLGGSPAVVVDTIRVPFGPGRDQLRTRALPEFAQLRARVHAQIHSAATRLTPAP